MYKLKQTVLMLCFILSGVLCYASGAAKLEWKEMGSPIVLKDEGSPIDIIESTGVSSSDKSNFISPYINGHELTVVFSENLGQVSVEVSTVSGASVHYTSVLTPNGLQIYIPNAGDYVITFTLPNGDEYYGEFTVTD